VVLLHGGYWRQRYGRELMDPLADHLAARGMVTWNVEYRRVGSGGGIPETLEDVAAAIDAVAALCAAQPGGSGPLVLVGHSAGGHLALCAAGRHRHRGSPATAPAAVVSLGGVCDLEAAARLDLSDGAAVDFAGASPTAWPLLYAEASPPRLLPLRIPTLLVHGTADESVPWQLSADLHREARAAGDDAQLALLDGVGHFEPIDPASDACSRWVAWLEARVDPGQGGDTRAADR
jgi:acetyl esterase/lipase